MNTFKALLLCIFSFISYLSNSQTITDLNYTVGKKQLEKLNNKVENYEQLSILFDTLKTKFLKEFEKANNKKFEYKENGCTAIADYFMDLAGSYHFDSSDKLQYVGFGKGYPIIYTYIECIMCQGQTFKFTNHRVVKFTLKDKTEYMFDLVISLTKPIPKGEWLEFYKKSNQGIDVKYEEITLKQSINLDFYSKNAKETIKKLDTQFDIKPSSNKIEK